MNIIKVYKLDEVGYQRDFTSLNEIWDLGLSMVKTNFTSNGRSLILCLSSCVLGKTAGKFRKNFHIIFSRQSHHLVEHVLPSVIVASSNTLFIGLLDLLIRNAISIGDGMIGMRQFVNNDRLRESTCNTAMVAGVKAPCFFNFDTFKVVKSNSDCDRLVFYTGFIVSQHLITVKGTLLESAPP